MHPNRTLVLVCCFLVAVLVPQSDLNAQQPSVQHPASAAPDYQGDPDKDLGITLAIAGILVSIFLGVAAHGGKNVAVGPVSVDVDTVHLHVGDDRDIVATAPFSNGNINSWDRGGFYYVKFKIDGSVKDSKIATFSAATQDTLKFTNPVEAGKIGTASVEVVLEVCGQDAGLVFDSFVCRNSVGVKQAGVLSPITLKLQPVAGQTFDHGVGETHQLIAENHSSDNAWVEKARVNAATKAITQIAVGNDYGSSVSTQVLSGSVNHTATHSAEIENVGFQWGSTFLSVIGKRIYWKDFPSLLNGTDFCRQIGKHSAKERHQPAARTVASAISSGCFTPGLLQLSDAAHSADMGGITVWLSNDLATATVHELVTGASGEFCWTSLDLNETVDLAINGDGNKPQIEQVTYEKISLEALENGTLNFNYVELLVPPITGELEASDGGALFAEVYSRRPGFADRLVGIIEDGPFVLDGLHMLEFNDFSSELVFVPIPPFNRTLMPATPIVKAFDPTFGPGLDLGTISFNIAPRSTAPMSLVSGTFVDESLAPVVGLQIEVHDGPTLIASDTTNASGDFSFTVPNGVATVSAPDLADLGLDPLPAESVDFGLNGSTTLDVGNRMMLPINADLLHADGFETGDTMGWSSTVP